MTAGDGATIFALSTAGLPSAIAIVRLSGPASGTALAAIAGTAPEPRRAVLRTLRDPADGAPIDRALLLWLPGPGTETGEDMVEFHIHGSRAVASKLLETLGKIEGLRGAEAGEFLRRAFLNGRLDLSEVEGLGDLLAAETEAQRRQALAMAEGGLAREIAGWRESLLAVEAALEAVLNFSDEGDVAEEDEKRALEAARDVHSEMAQALAAPPAERLRDGIRVVLAGPPNAGKSTLFNALVAREAAIVAPTAGTTRDVIEAPVAIDGLPFLFLDTAGLRDALDAIEDEGVRRARGVSEAADIVLWLGDPDAAPAGDHVIRLHPRADQPGRKLPPRDGERDHATHGGGGSPPDESQTEPPLRQPSGLPPPGPGEDLALAVSAVTGQGMAELRALLLDRARALLPQDGQLALSARQRAALADAAAQLAEAEAGDWVLLAENVRLARAALDRLSGRGGVEDMLDALFGRFCIGK